MTDSLFWLTLVVVLTALLWMPYILEFISRAGLLAALSLAEADAQKVNATPEWAERMKKAHYNAVANTGIFRWLPCSSLYRSDLAGRALTAHE